MRVIRPCIYASKFLHVSVSVYLWINVCGCLRFSSTQTPSGPCICTALLNAVIIASFAAVHDAWHIMCSRCPIVRMQYVQFCLSVRIHEVKGYKSRRRCRAASHSLSIRILWPKLASTSTTYRNAARHDGSAAQQHNT